MKRLFPIALILLTLALPSQAQVATAPSEKELANGGGKIQKVLAHRFTPPQLKEFLQGRTSARMFGRFNDYASWLWAVDEVPVWDRGCEIDDVKVQSPFPADYRPTWQEKLDELARQTDCSWHYNHDTGYFVFEPKPMTPPFTLKLAKDWKRRESGMSVNFVPPVAPVGMDVYVMGHYSSADPAQLPAVLEQARRNAALAFARQFKRDVTDQDFTLEKVAGVDAWFFTTPTPRGPQFKWRQWSFVKDGWCFCIVSVISDANEPQLLPDVKAMIASFAVRAGGPAVEEKAQAQEKP